MQSRPLDVKAMPVLAQYAGFTPGVADASVIAAVERFKVTEVATLDRRHSIPLPHRISLR